MNTIRFAAALAVALAWSSFASAASDPTAPMIDRGEVLRRGDHVEVVGTGIESAEEAAFTQSVATPADDNFKFHVSVFLKMDEQASAKLKADWEGGDPHLMAIGNPHDHKNSWTHLQFYDLADTSQEWRRANLKFTGYPSIVLQRPLNGCYGDHQLVALQIDGYDGDAEALMNKIVDRCTEIAKTDGGHQQADGEFEGPMPFQVPPQTPPAPRLPGVTQPQQTFPPAGVLSPGSWSLPVVMLIVMVVCVVGTRAAVKGPGMLREYRANKTAAEIARMRRYAAAAMEQAQAERDAQARGIKVE